MADLLLTNANLVDVRTGTVTADAAVAVDAGRIGAVGPRATLAADTAASARVLDLEGAYVLPGLINCHVHFGLVLPGTQGERLRGETESALALRMAANAAETLRAGVTTVRLVGERPYADLALRHSIERGETLGPRVLSAGPLLVSVGGHGWELPGSLQASGAEDFRRRAREQLKHGTDWLKISVSGGIAGENEAIADAQMTGEEIRAVVETAHARGRKVAAHAGPPAVIRLAVEQGVDSIEHGYFLDDETTAFMAARGAWLVPTINVSRALAFFERIGAPTWMIEKALAAGELHWAGLQAAIRNGVRIALGTDMMPHEPFDGTSVTVRELEFMAEAGMSSREALQAATIRAAELLGIDDDVGTLEPGKRADLIAVVANPVDDVSALRHLRAVVAHGRPLPSMS
jgi:imidazolonepropionase-like amidohydrolase